VTTAIATSRWVGVCGYDDLLPERAVAALVDGVQVAIVRTFDGVVHAVGNIDPFTGAAVISRGIVGTRNDRATIASPLYKQVFDLATGRCLDDDAVTLGSYDVRVEDDRIEVRVGY